MIDVAPVQITNLQACWKHANQLRVLRQDSTDMQFESQPLQNQHRKKTEPGNQNPFEREQAVAPEARLAGGGIKMNDTTAPSSSKRMSQRNSSMVN